jgi:hypothetical protein
MILPSTNFETTHYAVLYFSGTLSFLDPNIVLSTVLRPYTLVRTRALTHTHTIISMLSFPYRLHMLRLLISSFYIMILSCVLVTSLDRTFPFPCVVFICRLTSLLVSRRPIVSVFFFLTLMFLRDKLTASTALGGLVVIVLVIGSEVPGPKPGRGRWIFRSI